MRELGASFLDAWPTHYFLARAIIVTALRRSLLTGIKSNFMGIYASRRGYSSNQQ